MFDILLPRENWNWSTIVLTFSDQQVPRHRRASLGVPPHGCAQNPVVIFRGEPVAGANDADTVRRQGFAGGQIPDDVDRPAKNKRALLGFRRAEFDAADSIVSAARFLDQ